MANKTLSMQKVHDIIQLFVNGYSYRQISSITGVHRKSVTDYISCLNSSDFTPLEALQMSEEKLLGIFKKEVEPLPSNQKQLYWNEFLLYAQEELKNKHVTRQLLYKEYLEKYSQVFSYSYFCELLKVQQANKSYSLFQSFLPGEIMMADFAGDKLYYIDKETGEQINCEVLVVTLGYSGYTFAVALSNQTQECFISGLNDALIYFKGCPAVVRFDNLKAGVIKPNRYEPTFNTLMSMFCKHNSIVCDATRVAKPKDKAQVESHVNIIYKRIYAPLRNQTFYSINELNSGIVQLLKDHNERPYKGTSKSRWDYYQQEVGSLTTLPSMAFKRKYISKATVQKNYHVWLGHDEHYYSVHYHYVGKDVSIVYDADSVEIFHDYTRIAFHERKHKIGRYSTIREHMPESHIAVKDGIDPDWLKNQASGIGEYVLLFTEKLLNKGLLTPQHFKSTQGVLSLARKYPKERVDNACKRALEYNSITYKTVMGILEKNLDTYKGELPQIPIPFNPNTRGHQSFA